MKKRLFSIALALALCMGLMVPVSARISQGVYFFQTDYATMEEWNQKYQSLTGLTMFSFDTFYDLVGVRKQPITYYGMKDSTGKVVFPAEYSDFGYLPGNKIVARKLWFEDEGWSRKYSTGVVSPTGEIIYPFQENLWELVYTGVTAEPDQWTNTFIVETMDGNPGGGAPVGSEKQALYDSNFNELLPMEYSGIRYLADGYYELTKYNEAHKAHCLGIYKYDTGITISTEYREINYLGSDLFMVRRPDMYCAVLDGNGNQVLPFVFADITSAKNGYFAVAIFRDEAALKSAQSVKRLFPEIPGNTPMLSVKDSSDKPAYGVYGIIDKNQNALTDCLSHHEHANVFDNGYINLGCWLGQFTMWDPWADIANIQARYRVKKIEYLAIPLSELPPTGKTVSDLLREHGFSSSGTTVTPPSPPSVDSFTDVKSSDYFADAVLWAVEKNITSGTSKTTFSPNATCSKAQILAFLWRANGSPDPTEANPFDDIKTSDYFYKAALWAVEKGLVSGSTFGANTDCTRAMTMEYMWKAAGSPTPAGKADFTDVPGNSDYAQAVAWAVENEITSGTGGGNFSPAATCTRGQIVTFLHRAIGK